jgi:hypothetical protein
VRRRESPGVHQPCGRDHAFPTFLAAYNASVSLPVHVDSYSGYRPNERPIRFWLDATLHENELTGVYEIEAVEDRWYDPNAEYFKVRTPEGKRYILRYNQQQDAWTLQNGFDGGELLARPGVEMVTAGPEAVKKAESLIAGRENCRLACRRCRTCIGSSNLCAITPVGQASLRFPSTVSSNAFTDLPLVWHFPNAAKTETSSVMKATFTPPMLLLRREKLPEGPEWRYELKHAVNAHLNTA